MLMAPSGVISARSQLTKPGTMLNSTQNISLLTSGLKSTLSRQLLLVCWNLGIIDIIIAAGLGPNGENCCREPRLMLPSLKLPLSQESSPSTLLLLAELTDF